MDAEEIKEKLSRKIVELSTVVQMLFARNHERELELDAMNKYHKDEMKRALEEDQSKLNWLEKQLDDLERFRTLLKMKTEECDRTKATVDELQEKQTQAENKVNERGIMLNEALNEIENLKKEIANRSPDELARLQREKHELRAELAEEKTNTDRQQRLTKELEDKAKVIETTLQTMVGENDSLKKQCSCLQEELTKATEEIRDLSHSLQAAKRQGERALQRSRRMEENNRHAAVEKKMLLKCNEQMNDQVNKLLAEQQLRDKPIVTKQIQPSSPPSRADVSVSLPHHGQSQPIQEKDEVKKLKKEIEKYRLELRNREINFNRVFTEKTPLIIEKPPEITAEEMRLRNLTGLKSYRKTFPALPSVVRGSKPSSYEIHSNRTRR